MLKHFLIYLVKMDDRIVIFFNTGVIWSLFINFWKKQNHLNHRKRVLESVVKFCGGFLTLLNTYLKFIAKSKFRLDYSIKDDLLARRFWDLGLRSFFGALLMALAQQSLATKFYTNDKIFFKTIFHIFQHSNF